MLTRTIAPVDWSRTKMSEAPFLSFATRFVATLANATQRPSADSAPGAASWLLSPFPC